MEKKWLAVPAALALTLSLASCGYRTNGTDLNRTAYENDGITTAVPRSYNARTGVRGVDGTIYHNGRYAAYPNGTVSPGHGVLARDAGRLARDAELGIGGAAVGAHTALDNLGRDINNTTAGLR